MMNWFKNLVSSTQKTELSNRATANKNSWDQSVVMQRENVFSNLQKKWKIGSETDIVLISSEDRQIIAHKALLSASSVKFFDMLENAIEGPTELKIPWIDTATIRTILDHIYAVNFADAKVSCDYSNLEKLLDAAQKLELPALVNFSCSALGQLVTIENIHKLWEINEKYSNNTLHECLTARFDSYHRQLLEDRHFLKFTATFTEFALMRWRHMISTEILIIALLEWVKHDVVQRENMLPDLFKHIDTKQLTPEYITYVVEQEELLRKFPSILLQLYHSQPNFMMLDNLSPDDKITAKTISLTCVFALSKNENCGQIQFMNFWDHHKPAQDLPFNLLDEMCNVQYQNKIFFIGGDPEKTSSGYKTFVEYQVQDNVAFERENILKAVMNPVAKIINNIIYLIGKDYDTGNQVIQYYDITAGGQWRQVDCTQLELSDAAFGYIVHESSLLILKPVNQVVEVSKITNGVLYKDCFSIPFNFSTNSDNLIEYDDKIWFFDCTVGRKCIYDIVNDVVYIKSCKALASNQTTLLPIKSLVSSPFIIQFNIDTNTASLWNFITDNEFGKIVFKNSVAESMLYSYCLPEM